MTEPTADPIRLAVADPSPDNPWNRSEDPNAPRYGAVGVTSTFIQWKGTDLCMDFICACGVHSHFDGYFAYFVRCPGCRRVYAMPSNPAPQELTDRQVARLPSDAIVDMNDCG